jgi:hypothetical protein
MSANTRNRHFSQGTHGQREHGQTPAAMFLEAYSAFGSPAVGAFRRSIAGTEKMAEVLKDREAVLQWVLSLVDGRLATFDHDDTSARLTAEPTEDSRLVRLEFLTTPEA